MMKAFLRTRKIEGGIRVTNQESLDFLDSCIEYIDSLSEKEISDVFSSLDKNNENLDVLMSAF